MEDWRKVQVIRKGICQMLGRHDKKSKDGLMPGQCDGETVVCGMCDTAAWNIFRDLQDKKIVK